MDIWGAIKQFIAELRTYCERDWTGVQWLLLPIAILPLTALTVVLSGMGHAPLIFYFPFLLLHGSAVPMFYLFSNSLWALLIVPLTQGFFYVGGLRLLSPSHRWLVVKYVASIHVVAAIACLFWMFLKMR